MIFVLLSAGCSPETPPPDGDTEAQTPPKRADAQVESIPKPKRIILVSLDTVGSRHVGGYSDARTPRLDEIAREGVRFERFYASSTYTLPSHMSMLTGLDPIEHGVVNAPSRIAPEVPTLASKLQSAGYMTRAVVEGGFVSELHGFDQGFDDFKVVNIQKILVGSSVWEIQDWMRSQGESPYFLFLHTYAAHTPYGGFDDFRKRHPELNLPDEKGIEALKKEHNVTDAHSYYPAPDETPPELRNFCTLYNNLADVPWDFLGCGDKHFVQSFTNSEDFEAYRDGLVHSHREQIRRGDRMVGLLRDFLVEQGQWKDTLLVVTSDHGDAIFEHSVHGHDYTPFDEVIKVPLILSYPRRIGGGQVVRELTWHLDLFPTILSLAQVDFDSDLRGVDLSGVVLEKETLAADRAIHPLLLRPANRNYIPMRRMTLKGNFKFIEGSSFYGDPEGLLFDLGTSPDEDENLRQSRPEIFSELRELAQSFDADLSPGEPVHEETGTRISPFPGEVEAPTVSPEVQQRLEALGYIFDDADPVKAP